MIDLEKIVNFSVQAHGEQKYGKLPYQFHLHEVYNVAIEFGELDIAILHATWLHEILKNTKWNYKAIKTLAGDEVAEIVYAITDELGRDRKEQNKKTWEKIRDKEKALIVKQCDIIANVRHYIKTKSSKLELDDYKQEYPEFVTYMNERKSRGNEQMWTELGKLLLPKEA